MTVNESIRNKRGSAAALLAVAFLSLAMAVLAAIGISRRLVVKSECTVFGGVWCRAILSEYDTHLFEDYGILAYQGPDSEVDRKLNVYLDYSVSGKLDASIGKADSSLAGYEMNDPVNFRKAMRDSFAAAVIDAAVNGAERPERTAEEQLCGRVIENRVVIDTLPSRGIRSSSDGTSIGESLKSEDLPTFIAGKLGNSAVEVDFIRKYLGNHLTAAGEKPSYFVNEWEYIITGSLSDEDNFTGCRRKLFLIRNVLNLACLAGDSQKQALIASAAQLIAPGPGGVLLQAVITEAWAAAESDYDVKTLVKGGRVPLMKTSASWHTDIDGILLGSEVSSKLDEEGKAALSEHIDEIRKESGARGVAETISEGPSYEDYLLAMIAVTGENIRLLRTMDIVQINMKYRYYADFNLEEYYRGVRFNINANGTTYEFEDEYR